uniref:Uncharacterized protein n=1 Tax=Anguilla anguilla TaxID=7936 RepID=A0A0E9XHN3_ANGAN
MCRRMVEQKRILFMFFLHLLTTGV